MPSDLAFKVEKLRADLRANAPLLLAYSGGVDSACLLAFAQETLGDQLTAVIADSPSLPRQALTEALALARQLGAEVKVIRTREMADERYASNPLNRCYFCKAELFRQMDSVAAGGRYAALAYGENADDASRVRPGRKAATEFSVIAPLRDAGLTKDEIRQLSRELGLPTADAPAQPCLSSRIAHGTRVTDRALEMIEQSEAYVRSLGFRIFRVRHLAGTEGARAKVQIAPEEMGRLEAWQTQIAGALGAVGYGQVEFDPRGYRPPA